MHVQIEQLALAHVLDQHLFDGVHIIAAAVALVREKAAPDLKIEVVDDRPRSARVARLVCPHQCGFEVAVCRRPEAISLFIPRLLQDGPILNKQVEIAIGKAQHVNERDEPKSRIDVGAIVC